MNIIAIDRGSYSVKFIEGRLDRKSFQIEHVQEVPLDNIRKQYGDQELSITDLQDDIIAAYLEQVPSEGKIISQIPFDLVTSRFLDLPVTNKRKAEMMVPFQLDENLPFSTSAAHTTTTLEKYATGTWALVNITKREEFREYFDHLKENGLLPSVLTSELSLFQSMSAGFGPNTSTCFVDIGHRGTKAYFVIGNRVVSSHYSSIGGSLIDTLIAETYGIDHDEAVAYKHQSAFFLTDAQYNQVSDAQRDFALTMKQAMSPLISDLKRWILGHRVKYGSGVHKVVITGGTSRINNIDNFLAQSLGLEVEFFKLPKSVGFRESNIVEAEIQSYWSAVLMGATGKSKIPLANFLYGEFSSGYSQNIPLHSSSFIGMRVLTVCLILIAFLGVQRFFFIGKENKVLLSKIAKEIKSPELEVSVKQERTFKRYPLRIYPELQKRKRMISQEVKLVQSSIEINSVSPLASLSRTLGSNEQVILEHFDSEDKIANATFRINDAKTLETFKAHLQSLSIPKLNFEESEDPKLVKISFEGE